MLSIKNRISPVMMPEIMAAMRFGGSRNPAEIEMNTPGPGVKASTNMAIMRAKVEASVKVFSPSALKAT